MTTGKTIALTRRTLVGKVMSLVLNILSRLVIKEYYHSFRKGRRTRDQIANICWIMEKARKFQKNIYFCLVDYAKAFDCVYPKKLWKC